MTMRRIAFVAAVAAFALSGCSESTQYKGKIFDYARSITGKKVKPDPYVRARAPLVLPPGGNNLPAPKAKSTQIAANWPDDPDRRAKALIQARKEQAKENDRKWSWKGKSQKQIWEEMEEGHGRGLLDRLMGNF